jgi:hypothetical protein
MSLALIGIKLRVKTSNSGRAVARKLADEIRSGSPAFVVSA